MCWGMNGTYDAPSPLSSPSSMEGTLRVSLLRACAHTHTHCNRGDEEEEDRHVWIPVLLAPAFRYGGEFHLLRYTVAGILTGLVALSCKTVGLVQKEVIEVTLWFQVRVPILSTIALILQCSLTYISK